MAGRVVPRRGFPPSALGDGAGMGDINVRNKNKYHLNLGDSIGFFGEGSSKIINTAILGEVKLEIVFTSQVASCILGSASVADVPIYGSADLSLNSRLRDAAGADATFDTAANMAAGNSEFHRRKAVYQNFTNEFTSGDTGVPTLTNFNAPHDGLLGTALVAIAAEPLYIQYEMLFYILKHYNSKQVNVMIL